jgi:hypothetical protein
MTTKFLELDDDVLVEIAAPAELRDEMHSSTAEHVSTTMEMVAAKIGDIVRPLGDSFTHLYDALDVPVAVDSAEVELGVSFSAEGQVFIAKAKAEGTLKVKVVFKRIQVEAATTDHEPKKPKP